MATGHPLGCKSFREVWQETLQARKTSGLTAVSADLSPFLNRTTWPQSGQKLPEEVVEAVRCREILDVGVWARMRARVLVVVAMLSIFAIFVASDIMPSLKESLGSYWLPLGVTMLFAVVLAGMVVCVRCANQRTSSCEDAPASNASLANHVAALHLLYVSHSLAQAALDQVEVQPSCTVPSGEYTGQVRERCVHTVTACGSRYLVMRNGRVFVDR
jgi:uncharacterized integral membrane protein